VGLPAGKTNNPAGRPPGSKNQSAEELRRIIKAILADNFSHDKLQRDLDLLEPKDRLYFYERLLHYSLPKLQATSIYTVEPPPAEVINRPAWLDAAI
jgi:hypothetical protein